MWKKIKSMIFLLFGILSVIYFIVCVAYSGSGLSWIWIWPLFAGFCLVRFWMLRLEIKDRFPWKIPRWISVAYRIVFAAFLIVFIWTESRVVSQMTSEPQQGIEESRILMEDQSTSTEENLRNSFAMIPTDAGTVGILTNGFHIYRSLLIAQELGHENVTGVPARTLFPVGIHYVVREFFAVIKLRLVPVQT